jgi:hypothetical protein
MRHAFAASTSSSATHPNDDKFALQMRACAAHRLPRFDTNCDSENSDFWDCAYRTELLRNSKRWKANRSALNAWGELPFFNKQARSSANKEAIKR